MFGAVILTYVRMFLSYFSLREIALIFAKSLPPTLIGTTMVPAVAVIEGAIVMGAFPEQSWADTGLYPIIANRKINTDCKAFVFIFFTFRLIFQRVLQGDFRVFFKSVKLKISSAELKKMQLSILCSFQSYPRIDKLVNVGIGNVLFKIQIIVKLIIYRFS